MTNDTDINIIPVVKNFANLGVKIFLRASLVNRRNIMMAEIPKENLRIFQEDENIFEISEIKTPYVLLAHNHFDFDPDDSQGLNF